MTTGTDNGSATGGQAAGTQAGTQSGAEARADALQNGSSEFVMPPEMAEWGKSKGYNPERLAQTFKNDPDAYAMANSYRNAEKLLGGEKLVVPKDASDQAGWDALYSKLGRPGKAEEYKLPLPDGSVGGEFEGWAKNTFHKAGVTQQQAELLGKEWVQMMNGTIAKDEADMKAAAAAQQLALDKEWGADAKSNTEIATRAFARMGKDVGLDGADLDAMEKAIGLQKSMKIMNYLGRGLKLDSDKFEGSGDGSRGVSVKSAEGAKVEKANLWNDAGFRDKYNKGDVLAVQKIKSLNEIIASSNPTYSGN